MINPEEYLNRLIDEKGKGLSKEAKRKMRAKLSNDHVSNQQEESKDISEKLRQKALLKQVKAMHKEYRNKGWFDQEKHFKKDSINQEEKKPRMRYLNLMKLAASVLLLISSFFYIESLNSNKLDLNFPVKDMIAQKINYEKSEEYGSIEQNDFLLMFDPIFSGKENSIDYLSSLSFIIKDSTKQQEAFAFSALVIDQDKGKIDKNLLTKSIDYLEQNHNKPDWPILRYHTDYYLLIGHLKLGNFNAAKDLIKNSFHVKDYCEENKNCEELKILAIENFSNHSLAISK